MSLPALAGRALRRSSLFAAALSLALFAPAALHATPITYNLVLTPNAGSLYGGTGSFTIESAPSVHGNSDFTQAAQTLDSLNIMIDGQSFSFANEVNGGNALVRFLNGSLNDITFSAASGSSPMRFAFQSTSGYAFYYNNNQSASYGTFTASLAPTTSPVPEPESLALLASGLFGGAGMLVRRIRSTRA